MPLDGWPEENRLPGRALLDWLVGSERAVWESDSVVVPHAVVADLSDEQAARLSLPPPVPHALQLRSRGRLDEADFAIESAWYAHGIQPVRLRRTGAIAEDGDRFFRLPGKLYSIVEAVERLNAAEATDRASRTWLWPPVQEALQAATGEKVSPDGYLADLRLFHASSLSLAVEMTAEKGVTFDPVLFGRAAVRRHRDAELLDEDPLADPAIAIDEGDASVEGLDTLVDQADALLSPELDRVFVRERFNRDARCRPSYPLARNTYLIIDDRLRQALDLVKQKQATSPEERKAFVKNPRAAIASALDLSDDAPLLGTLFVETQQFAERVTGIGVWQPRVLPWLPTTPNSWLPEKIGFYVDGQTIEVQPERLAAIHEACRTAMQQGQAQFAIEGVGTLPASEETLAAIDRLADVAKQLEAQQPEDGEATSTAPEEAEDRSSERHALEQTDNLEEVGFTLGFAPRLSQLDPDPPADLIAPGRLFPHQREGFDWMRRAWLAGRPGVLLADDMGLGKTIQTLAFAAWLHTHCEQEQEGRRAPFLIVAPTALLKNWRAEHDTHLQGGGIGPLVELYGSSVRAFRKNGETRRDVEVGRAVLDRERLAQAPCILTTYETLANYHISLAAIRFPLVVFDEIQKLKTPTTINTHAAKTLNADFALGLTGTPVENSLSELWSIVDRLHPGLFGDLRSFSQAYRADDWAALRDLHDQLVRAELKPAIMLRRMKDTTDLGQALPPRKFKPLVRDMPELQAKAYAACVALARRRREEGANRGMMLQALHRMRSISLHPDHPSTVIGRPERYRDYVGSSARLEAAVDVLDEIREAGEKALVFIEFLEMQDLFAEITRERYALSQRPAIVNGQTPSAQRQDLVARFQAAERRGFDVMILSPRAAGVGLTITAANHVLHLSRWWNPAVEAQCNDRAYRIGQNKPVTVYLPIARHPQFGNGSFDVRLDALLERKRRMSQNLLVPAETESDYNEILSSTLETA